MRQRSTAQALGFGSGYGGGLLLAVSVACLISAPGCTHQGLAQERWDARLQKMERLIRLWREREAQNPAKLERDWRWIDEQIAEDQRQFDRDVRWLESKIQSDFERFEERQPAYREKAEKILRGKPEQIVPYGIRMFF